MLVSITKLSIIILTLFIGIKEKNETLLRYRKSAQLEGLEVDQYMWGILNTLNTTEVDEVTIDSLANWKPAKNLTGIKSEEENDCKRTTKAMSPGSMNMPTMNNWDMNQAMSPYIPPDMNSIVSGSMMNNTSSTYQNSSINHRNTSGGTYEINSGTNTIGNNDYVSGTGPLSHLNESVNSLDPLNAMEKSLNDQVCFAVISIMSKNSNIEIYKNDGRILNVTNIVVEKKQKQKFC